MITKYSTRKQQKSNISLCQLVNSLKNLLKLKLKDIPFKNKNYLKKWNFKTKRLMSLKTKYN